MNILLFGMSSYPGGVENYIVNYFCHPFFPSKTIHLDFITYETVIAYEQALAAKDYRVFRVPNLKRNPVGYYKSVKRIMQNGQYDAVYVNMLTAANAFPIYLAKKEGIRVIILHAHACSTIEGAVRRSFHTLNKQYCRKSASIRLSCSKEAGEWLFGNEQYTIIPNAIDCDRFRPSMTYREKTRMRYNISKETLLIGHIGRFATEKNHEKMISVLLSVLSKGVDAKMMLVGDGYNKDDILRKVKKEGLSGRVIFINTTQQTEKYYPAFDVFLFPSAFEGFGMAALEAQSCGVPCVCSDTLSPSLNITGSVRYLSLLDSPSRWADEVIKAQTSHEDEERMHKAVQESEFNIKNQISSFIELIESKLR